MPAKTEAGGARGVVALADELETDGGVEGQGSGVRLDDEWPLAGATKSVLEAGAAEALAAMGRVDAEERYLQREARSAEGVDGEQRGAVKEGVDRGVRVLAGSGNGCQTGLRGALGGAGGQEGACFWIMNRVEGLRPAGADGDRDRRGDPRLRSDSRVVHQSLRSSAKGLGSS